MSIAVTLFWVRKHPTPSILATALCDLPADADPEQWEQLSQGALEEWKAAEIASGWIPQPEPMVPETIPWAISNADLRRGLISRGINPAAVLAKLQTWPESPAKWEAIADYEYANYFERTHPMLDLLAPEFELTAEDIDEIFRSKPPYPR